MAGPQERVSGEVTIAETDEGWRVSIHEPEGDASETFDIERHARSYADGQRVRLGLPVDNKP